MFNKKIIKFGIVGAIGSIINFGVYKLVTIIIPEAYSLAAVAAFIVAVTNNYILNHLWTFKQDVSGDKISFRYYLKYIAVNLLGLGINLAVLNIIIYFFGNETNLIGQAFGIIAGMISNYLFSNYFVFRIKRKSNE